MTDPIWGDRGDRQAATIRGPVDTVFLVPGHAPAVGRLCGLSRPATQFGELWLGVVGWLRPQKSFRLVYVSWMIAYSDGWTVSRVVLGLLVLRSVYAAGLAFFGNVARGRLSA